MPNRVYSHLLDPAAYPDYGRREYRVPTWATFDHRTQFTCLRAFSIRDNRLVHFREDLDLYEQLNLGRVIWPVFQTVFAENFKDLVEEIKKRNLFLFDIWGHVPGSGLEGMWSHVMPPEGMVAYLQKTLGDRFLGFDNGEQDGRYVSGFAHQQCPSFADRFRQYLNFQRHFQRMGEDLGNKLTTLVSLCYGHYFLKEGNHMLIGAETAQALPNSQVYYAFIRGAGKQYGVHWFGNASIWNRWGYKNYEDTGDAGYKWGPTEGTSLNLLRRLIYSHYLYNCVAVGFESAWLMGDNVEKRIEGKLVKIEEDRTSAVPAPVGVIQQQANEFVARHGRPGVMQTPVALLLDFYSGWTMPRHLYSQSVFQVWGAMPYEPGDFFTHAVFSMLYPGYEDASYFRDERGFLAPTPYGDCADVLLSDAPSPVMSQYNLIVAAGTLRADAELRDKLDRFVRDGGHLVITADNARTLWPQWQIGQPVNFSGGTKIQWEDGTATVESDAFTLCSIRPTPEMKVPARCGSDPVVVQISMGQGRVTLLLSPTGLNREPAVVGPVENAVEKPLANPFRLLNHVRRVLDQALAGQRLFTAGVGLSWITCRKGPGEYVLGVHNNDLSAKPFRIESSVGTIRTIEELPIDQRAKDAVGYWPTGREDNNGGTSDAGTLTGGDFRIFRIQVDEKGITEIPPVQPPKPVKDRWLALWDVVDIKEAILARPTFFQHFDGVKIDWTYLRDRDRARLQSERGWLDRQKVRVAVDFSHGLNFYPDLTILDTLMFRYEESLRTLDDILEKMALIGSTAAVFCLHRIPENHCSDERAHERFRTGLKDLCRRAARHGIALFLQSHPAKWYPKSADMLAFIDKVGADNLRFALNTAHVAMAKEEIGDVAAAAGARLGLILYSAPTVDPFGQTYDAHRPVCDGNLDLASLSKFAVPKVFDADYQSWTDTYRDIKRVWG